MPPQTIRAAIYCRVSQDDAETGLGVARQEADGRALAAAKGWEVGRVFIDNATSAYQRGKPRPAYQAMLAELRAGNLQAIVCYALDRLYRRYDELPDLINLCESGQVGFAACSGEYDLSTGDGRFMAQMMVSVAEKASADTSRRQRRKMLEIVAAGRAHGGPRAYGFIDRARGDGEPGRRHQRTNDLDPYEAAVIREVAERVLAGGSVRGACLMLNARGDFTPQGKSWSPTSLRRMLLRPRTIGKREHNGEVHTAAWPAIISEEQQIGLRAIFSRNEQKQNLRGRPALLLLSGLMRCGECGATMRHSSGGKSNRRAYQCPPAPRGHQCVSVQADKAEAYLTSVALSMSDQATLDTPGDTEPDQTDAIARQRVKLTELQDAYDDDAITIEQHRTGTRAARQKIADLEAGVAEAAIQRASVLPMDRLRDQWVGVGMTTDDRRAAIRSLLGVVTVDTQESVTYSDGIAWTERFRWAGAGSGDAFGTVMPRTLTVTD